MTIIDTFNAQAQLDTPRLYWQSLTASMPGPSSTHLCSLTWQVWHTYAFLPDKFVSVECHTQHTFLYRCKRPEKILMHTQSRFIFDCLKFRKGKCLEVLHYLVHLLLGQKRLYRKFLPNIMMYFKFTLREHYYSCFI